MTISKRLWLLAAGAILALGLSLPVSAQPVHGAPQGVTLYPNSGAWPWTTSQCHWKASSTTPNPAGPLVPGISHLHIEGNLPIWAELGSGPITVPITIRLFQTDGEVAILEANFEGPNGPAPVTSITVDGPFPIIGNPTGLVSVPGHMTFDPSKAFLLDAGGKPTTNLAITQHGWFNLQLFARTYFNSGESLSDEFWVPFWSMLDPSVPESTQVPEGTQEFASKCEVQSNADTASGVWGIHLTEFRTLTYGDGYGYSPILAPFNTPQIVRPLTYSYGNGDILPPSTYELRLDANFHMGIAGSVLATTSTEIPGGVTNVDTLDPTVIAASPPPAGATPGMHRLFYMWNGETGPTGSTGTAPNERLVALLGEEVAIGSNPIGPPPPTLCTDPTATNVGQPLPCTYPVPPPAQVWQAVSPTFNQLFIGGVPQPRFQLCVLPFPCVEVTVK